MEERGDSWGVLYNSGDVLVDIFSLTISSDCTATMSSSTGVTTKRYYYHVNHLGSVVWISDNSGNILQTYTYDSFGKAYIVNWSWALTSIDSVGNLYGNSRLYTGREYDREINLYFLRARYYDASTGKFISRDPIWQRDQVNLYTYVKNSSLVYMDRMGLNSKPVANTQNVWDWYMKKSDEFGGYLHDNISPYEQDIIATIDRTRRYSGYVWLAAVPALFIPPATPFAAWIIGATGVMSFAAGVTESVVTQDLSYGIKEWLSFGIWKLGWVAMEIYLKSVWSVTKVEFNTEVGRYMGQYANWAYWFVKSEIWQASIMISQGTEQVMGYFTQKLTGE